MSRKEKRYHFIYKTTNTLSGKYYIGMHSTDNLEDGYLGSGTRLRRSIRKYGEDNFKREILEYCETRGELKKREEEMVTLNEIAKEECINLKVGGEGGWTIEQQRLNAKKSNDKQKILRETNPEWVKKKSEAQTKTLLNDYKEGRRERRQVMDWTGKKHTDEAKKKMSESMKNKGLGKTNSQYGSMWITNDIVNKKVIKGDNIPDGWRRGRIINKK